MNSKQHIKEFIPDFLMGSFDEQERSAIELHMKSCAECLKEYETLSMLWNSLGTLPKETPSPALRDRFYTMLAAYEQGMKHPKRSFGERMNEAIGKFWPQRPLTQFALTLLLFIAGGFAGLSVRHTPASDIAPTRQDTSSEISQLHLEIQSMNRMLAVSLMQQQSASERLRGITLSSQFRHPDIEVMSALFRALNYDPNVNVRLAAVDALQEYGNTPEVRKGIIEALGKDQSPMVQVALIDVLVSLQVQSSKPVMKDLLKDPKLNNAVKSRIEFALNELKG